MLNTPNPITRIFNLHTTNSGRRKFQESVLSLPNSFNLFQSLPSIRYGFLKNYAEFCWDDVKKLKELVRFTGSLTNLDFNIMALI